MANADVQRSVWQSRFQMPPTCSTILVLRPTTIPLDHIDAFEQYYGSNCPTSNNGFFNDQQRRRQPAIGDRRSPSILKTFPTAQFIIAFEQRRALSASV
jgi:hypothetical protein